MSKRGRGTAGNLSWTAGATTQAVAVRPVTKRTLLIEALRGKTDATVSEMMDATGWQAHSVRGAISSTLKKTLGLDVVSEKVEGRGRVCRTIGRGGWRGAT